ncbi:hypothetical protein [Halovenus marina]|uniref:hypothetical protein n=1 Tax=Halovenus marina TaxID=3396621 RepID=UPI003F56F547
MVEGQKPTIRPRRFSARFQEQKLVPEDGDESYIFGESAVMVGQTAVVGAIGAVTSDGERTGAAYVFEQTGGEWVQQTKLTPRPANEDARFGKSVAVTNDGTRILVGAPKSTGNTGAVYVFELGEDRWSQQAILKGTDVEAKDQFGWSVSIDGDTALIGANQAARSDELGVGAAYVFVNRDDQWRQEAKLTTEDVDANDNFGTSVTLKRDTALVGVQPSETGAEPNVEQRVLRAAYVFTRDTEQWHQQAELTVEGSDRAGLAVALDGDNALVGAPDIDAVYAYERGGTGWSQQTELTATDRDGGDWFGESLVLHDNTAIVGAPRDEDPNGRLAGSAYVFLRDSDGWIQHAKLAASDGSTDENFGRAVAMANDTVLVGVPWDSEPNGSRSGSVYLYTISRDETVSNTRVNTTTSSDTGPTPGETTNNTEAQPGEIDGDDTMTDQTTGEDGTEFTFLSAIAVFTGAGYLLWRWTKGTDD